MRLSAWIVGWGLTAALGCGDDISSGEGGAGSGGARSSGSTTTSSASTSSHGSSASGGANEAGGGQTSGSGSGAGSGSGGNEGGGPATGSTTTNGAGGQGGTDDELTSLPPDSGGAHTQHPLGTTDADYGYWGYVPGGYDDTDKSYPLIVCLHGKGERGNGGTDLGRVLSNGIPKLIEQGGWEPTYPVVVGSPQYPSPDGVGNDNNWGEGDPAQVRAFIEHMMATYRINPARIYLTGLSHGGNGVYDYLVLQDEATSHLAAAAPIAAWGPNNHFDNSPNTPIWVFVGSNDGSNFGTSRNFVAGYNAQDPAPLHPARFTVYPGAGHDVWTRTYDLSGMGTADPEYDPYDMGLYDWMFQYKRSD